MTNTNTTPSGNEAAKRDINGLIDTYIHSINVLDIPLAETFWLTTPQVTFIHPRGHEHGWDQVVMNFYGETMGESFTKRTLKLVGIPDVQMYGDAAMAEFEWDFVAVRRDNGEALHTTGRESQMWVRGDDAQWRLVQVHYSGPAVTGAGQGF